MQKRPQCRSGRIGSPGTLAYKLLGCLDRSAYLDDNEHSESSRILCKRTRRTNTVNTMFFFMSERCLNIQIDHNLSSSIKSIEPDLMADPTYLRDPLTKYHCLQAATSTFESQSSKASALLIVSPLTGGNRQTVIPNPLIFKLVTNGPSVSLLTTNPRVARSAIAISANRASTSSLVLPRELSRITTSLSVSGDVDEEKGMKARSASEMSRSRSSIWVVSDSGEGMGLSCRRPGSPCAPIPSSIVAGGRLCRSVSVAFGNATLVFVSFEHNHEVFVQLTDQRQLQQYRRLWRHTP
jgi:hypothetical protein